MPTYEYECKKCKKKFDFFQNMSEEPIKKCSDCGGVLKRLIGSGSGIIFKSSGFYATDHKKSKSQKPPACKDSCNLPSCPKAG